MASLAALAPSRITLRTAFALDGAVTGANGAAYLLAAEPIGDVTGLAPSLLRILGAVLIAYAVAVWSIGRRPTISRRWAIAVVAVNAAWALGSVVAAVGGLESPTTAGTVWIVAQAIVVAGLAELQATALGR